MRTLTFLAVALLLTAPVLAQPGGRPGGAPDDMPRGMRAEHAGAGHMADWENLSAQARERGLARAESAGLFARFAYENGEATGRFVTFGLDPATGEATDYTLTANGSVAFFDAVTPEPWMGAAEPRVTGAVVRLAAENASFAAHNNPTGLFVYRAEGAPLSVAVDLADGATASDEGNRSTTVSAGGIHGHLVVSGNGTLAVDGESVTVDLEEGASLLFLGHPAGRGAATENLHALRDAVRSERLGGVLNVVEAEGEAVDDRVFLGVSLRPTDVAPGRLEVEVSSDADEGKAVVVNLERAIVNVTDAGALTVLLDGEEIPAVANASAALGAAPGSPAVYFATVLNETVQVVVNVPEFSTHTLTVEGSTPGDGAADDGATDGGADGTAGGTTDDGATDDGADDAPAQDTPGFGLVAALVALGALAASRRR